MVFLFLLLSLVVSAIREAIEARLKTRSAFLAHAIQEMLTDTHAKSLYEHPLIKALYDGGKYETDAAGFTGNNGFKWIWNVVKSLRVHTNLPSLFRRELSRWHCSTSPQRGTCLERKHRVRLRRH